MDDLDQQLAHLQLMNARDLSPKPQPPLPSQQHQHSASSVAAAGTNVGPPGLVKKVGPAVPPKPNKKPVGGGGGGGSGGGGQSLLMHHLQPPPPSPPPPAAAAVMPAAMSPPPPPPPLPTNNNHVQQHLLQQKPSNNSSSNSSNTTQAMPQANAGSHNIYSNIQLTLDNPAILEQKLEALEHHKRVLESQRRAAVQQQQQPISEPPPPAPPAAYDGKIYENQQQLYENMKLPAAAAGPAVGGSDVSKFIRQFGGGATAGGGVKPQQMHQHQQHQPPQQQLYGNVETANNTYSNYAAYNSERSDELPPPPPPTSSVPTVLNLLLNNDYQQLHGGHLSSHGDDELPPPPSPVSSSYSELRRATDHSVSGTVGGGNGGYPIYPIGGGGNNGGSSAGNYQHLNNGNMHLQQQQHHHHHHHHDQQLHHQQQQQQQYAQQQPMHQHHHHANGGGGATYANNYVGGGGGSGEYGDYGGSLPGSSTYESIYEPINPRPPSQMSSRSNYSLYNPYVSGPQGAGGVGAVSGAPQSHNGGSNGGTLGRSAGGKQKDESEVDLLTDLLVQSMDGSGGAGAKAEGGDSYGVCVQCGDRVVGESSGCTAMEQIYHITCFTCCQCQINLQGKPFYALDGKPCCEEDYLNTLEKCSVCMKPILERILRATGKPYHPGCFCCVVCGKSLDGVPFTVDATNQNHCIEDFHKKFAPRCCVCRQPILPEPGKEETVRVVALDRSFHVACYKCEDCGMLLSSEAEGRGCFPLDDHILCKSCNAKRVQTLTSHMSTEL